MRQASMRVYQIFFLCQNIVLGQFVGIQDKTGNMQEKNLDDLIPRKEPSTGSAFNAEQSEPNNYAYVEVLIVIDKKLSEVVSNSYSYGVWNSSLLNAGDSRQDVIVYLKKFISAVNFRFQTNFENPSIQLTISGFLRGQSFAKSAKDDEDALDSINTLHHMSFAFGAAHYRKDHHFDIVLFLTDKKICSQSCKEVGKITGDSNFEGACDDIKATQLGRTHGVAIVQDFGAFSGVDTAAYHIGHLLGARDDGDNNPCSSDDGYIMSEFRTKKTLSKGNAYKFSKCSVKSIKTFLKTQQAKDCLFTDPLLFSSYKILPWRELVAPQVPSLRVQCSVSKTPEGISGFPSVCGENPCRVLECVSGLDCLAFLPAVDGSRCNNQGAVCYQGDCVQKDTSTSEDQWWAGKCLIKGAGKSLPIGAYRNAWDCLDRCQGAQIQDNYTACEYSKAKGECQAYTGQVEHTTGEFTWSSKSLCYVFKKDGGGSDSAVKTYAVTQFAGYCLDSKGKDQNSGVKKLRNGYPSAKACLKGCNNPLGAYYSLATGCEFHSPGCWIHTGEVASGGGNSEQKRVFTCFVLKQKECSFSKSGFTLDPSERPISIQKVSSASECADLCLDEACNFWSYDGLLSATCQQYRNVGQPIEDSPSDNSQAAWGTGICKDKDSPDKKKTTKKYPGKEEKSRCKKNPGTHKPWGKDEIFIECPHGWMTFDRRCYKFIFTNEQDLTFAKSLQLCSDRFPEVKLVEIDSEHQQRWIEKQIQKGWLKVTNEMPFHISKPKDIEKKQKNNEDFYFGPISGVTPVQSKLNDPKICLSAVYNPLLCNAPWQYIPCSKIMKVKNVVCMFEQKQKGESPIEHGPYDELWTDDQCKNLGRGSKVGKLKNCAYSCLVTPNCTAINFSPSPDCVLRACPTPVPKPNWKHLNYKGYTVLRYSGSTTDPLTKGPFEQIWTDEECPNIGQGSTNGNIQDCKNNCHSHVHCNAVNFSSDDCVLRHCPIPIPKPNWKYKGYKGYST